MIVVTYACVVAATVVTAARWLRVAQREHYLAGSVTRFAIRWWRSGPANGAIFAIGIAGVVVSKWWSAAGFAVTAACLLGPWGLGLTGRTSPLKWTRRLSVLAGVSVILATAVLAGTAVTLSGSVALVIAGCVALAAPLVIDLALLITSPFEVIAARRFVTAATEKLRRIHPTVVAITGSYGKTSTKNYVAHLLSAKLVVVPSPASFNNTAGLSRAVNEKLALGTDVFLAEMGTYGPGEIAAMCAWMPPDVAVITAIGPVHLERMRTEETVLVAKAEICEKAAVVVLNVEDARLAALADRLEAAGKTVRRATREALPSVDLPEGVSLTNAACAVEVARHFGVPEDELVRRLADLPAVPNRRTAYLSESGFLVIDDTYNSNPAGCREALALLARSGVETGRRCVVTPGMVELGPQQYEANRAFASEVIAMGADLVIVGRTNRRALRSGAEPVLLQSGAQESGAASRVVTVKTRPEAVAWVRAHLSEGAVLYENDLPDHYP